MYFVFVGSSNNSLIEETIFDTNLLHSHLIFAGSSIPSLVGKENISYVSTTFKNMLHDLEPTLVSKKKTIDATVLHFTLF